MCFHRRFLLVGSLLLAGVLLGCSSQAQPIKDGAPAPDASQASKPIPINPENPNKFLDPETQGPPAPPVKPAFPR